MSAELAENAVERPDEEVRPFLSAIATALRETVAAFESTVSRVTEITVTRPGKADRDLVVVLQEFDRLQQEFSNLSEVIAKLSLKSAAGAETDAFATISVADLKDRLARHIRALTVDLPAGDTADEVVF